MVLKGGRKRRFAYTKMNVWPAGTVNKEQEKTQRPCDVTFDSRLHHVVSSLNSKICFS